MKKFVSVIALVSAGLATPAFAQDSAIEPYAGVLVGYDHVRASDVTGSESKDGLVYGGFIGAQSAIGETTLIGIEAEVTGATTKVTERNFAVAGDEARLSAGRDFFIGARLGFRPAPALLAYAKGGYTNARLKFRYTAPAGGIEVGENLDGYRIGAGLELGEGALRFRGEYRFSDYGDFNVGGFATDISTKRHQVVVGALFAF